MDAISYLKTVEELFKDEREKYEEFVRVIQDLSDPTINVRQVVQRVAHLLEAHPCLIPGFNAFLPAGYIFTHPLIDSPSSSSTSSDASSSSSCESSPSPNKRKRK